MALLGVKVFRGAISASVRLLGAVRHAATVEGLTPLERSPPVGSQISPFHLAIPVPTLASAREFYGNVLGLTEGRTDDQWIDYNFFGHQLVAHLAPAQPDDKKDHCNHVDGDEVPVPHFGVCLQWGQFERLAERLRSHGIKFIVQPHVRFPGRAGEQYTMFFKDFSGNNLEFKAMKNPAYLFQKQ